MSAIIKPETTDAIAVPVPIVSSRLVFYPPRAGDGVEVAAFVDESYDALVKWMPWARDRKDATDAEACERRSIEFARKFAAREDLMLRGFDITTGKLVVFTGLHRFNWTDRSFEIGYCVRRCFEGKGYATETANALTRYAFDVLGAKKVRLEHADGNVASRKVITKLGFVFTGRTPRREPLPDGSMVDNFMYERTSKEGLPNLRIWWENES
ncbi:MAG: GNAT family N-acetyltransferase [Alphaproteobacteria bacterium]|nr:GNAT family N-acetyltransferase [Alphaproteobacteria bacterium]